MLKVSISISQGGLEEREWIFEWRGVVLCLGQKTNAMLLQHLQISSAEKTLTWKVLELDSGDLRGMGVTGTSASVYCRRANNIKQFNFAWVCKIHVLHGCNSILQKNL